MHYEFELFDTIIYNLSRPFIYVEKDLSSYRSVIEKKHPECFNIIIATFKKGSKGPVLASKRSISSLHPEMDIINKLQLCLFQDDITKILDRKSIKTLGVNHENVIHHAIEAAKNNSKIYIKVKGSIETLSAPEIRYYYYNVILKDELHRIKKSITDQVFKLGTSIEIENYIHKLQQTLINLAFRVSRLFDSDKIPSIYKSAEHYNDSDIFYLIYNSIEDLIRFFEVSFFKYMDQNIQIPCRSALVKIYSIDDKLEVVKSAFLASNIESELMNIIYEPFLELSVFMINERITYKKLIYSNTFLTAFYDEVQKGDNKLTFPIITNYLYHYNFNSLFLVNYKIQLIKNKLTEYSETTAQIDYLYHCLKVVNQRQCKSHIAYEPDLPSLKVQIINWLEEEINYLNKKISLTSQQPSLFDNSIDNKLKIMSGLSVPQLAHFYRLLYEVGIITHDNQSDIIRFLSDNFQTVKTKNISIDSLKNKFYYTEETTIVPLKDYVIKILNKLKD